LNKIEGYYIEPNRVIKGKITIPSFHPVDKKPIISIG
jgi:hypothetical protein